MPPINHPQLLGLPATAGQNRAPYIHIISSLYFFIFVPVCLYLCFLCCISIRFQFVLEITNLHRICIVLHLTFQSLAVQRSCQQRSVSEQSPAVNLLCHIYVVECTMHTSQSAI